MFQRGKYSHFSFWVKLGSYHQGSSILDKQCHDYMHDSSGTFVTCCTVPKILLQIEDINRLYFALGPLRPGLSQAQRCYLLHVQAEQDCILKFMSTASSQKAWPWTSLPSKLTGLFSKWILLRGRKRMRPSLLFRHIFFIHWERKGLGLNEK